MPTEFYIDTRLGVVFTKATGLFTLAETLDFFARLKSHPDFSPDYDHFMDSSETVGVGSSGDEISFAATQSCFSPVSLRAVLVSSELHYGLGRMYESYRELGGETGVRTFRDKTEALAWLGLPVATETHPRVLASGQDSTGRAA